MMKRERNREGKQKKIPKSGKIKGVKTGCFEYFFALYEDAMSAVSYNRSSGKHLIINKVQLDYVNNILKIMAVTIPEDENKANCTAAMDEIVRIVVDAESVRGGGLFRAKKLGYEYNYEISNADTRSTGRH